jgi:DNA-binding protein HU-beta
MAEKKPMSKAQLVDHVAASLGVKKANARSFIEGLAGLAAKEVKRTGQFVLPGFGKLVLAKRKARTGRNPQTGEPIKIPAKTVLKFRLAKALKDTVLPKK